MGWRGPDPDPGLLQGGILGWTPILGRDGEMAGEIQGYGLSHHSRPINPILIPGEPMARERCGYKLR